MAFQKAVKRDAKLRLALCGPAGSGKTFTGLALATALGGPVAYVDTEHGSASKYAHTDKCGGPGTCADPSHFEFDVEEPASFDPRDLIDFIDEAVKRGYRVMCIDSLSHYWMGPNGELDLVDATAKRDTRGNSFAAWKTVTPIHNALVDKILSAPIHVIVSMRTKTEWVVEKDEKGKSVPRKIGLAPIMRDGIEFEFDVCGDLDQDNNFTVTKSRCSTLAGKVINRPGKGMAATLSAWLGSGPEQGATHPQNPVLPAGQPTAPAAAPTAGSAGNSSGAPSAPVQNSSGNPRVDALWARMGADGATGAKQRIQEVLEELKSDMWELCGDRATTEYAAIVKQFGDPFQKFGFARRVVLEMVNRILAINKEITDSVAAEAEDKGQGSMFEKQEAYAD